MVAAGCATFAIANPISGRLKIPILMEHSKEYSGFYRSVRL
jgi:hypothetical protein